MDNTIKIIILLTISLCHSVTHSKRIANEKIYQKLQSEHFCFRRLNATHSIGCQSEASGNVGVIHIVKNETDLNWILKDGRTSPFIPVITIEHFTKNILSNFQNSKRVTGLFLVVPKNGTSSKRSYSPDKACPNENFGLYTNKSEKYKKYSRCSKHPEHGWNQKQDSLGMMFEEWNFPIFLLNDDKSYQYIHDCYKKFNEPKNGVAKSWPLCAAQLNARMKAAKDTPTCMRRNNLEVLSLNPKQRFCDPISNYNVFNSMFSLSPNSTILNRSIIILASRMDSFSIFNEISPGADSVITSLVALLSVAKTLSKSAKDIEDKVKGNVLYSIFDGESWDYVGSSRAAYDMKRKEFKPSTFIPIFREFEMTNITIDHISTMIEFNQLASYHEKQSYYIHTDPLNFEKTKSAAQKLIDELQKSDFIKRSDEKMTLPPSSVQSFLREDDDITGIVLSNFDKTFENKFYNSFLDDEHNFDLDDQVKRISAISKAVSSVLLKELTEKESGNIKVDNDFIEILLNCFINDSTCDYLKSIGVHIQGGLKLATYTSVMTIGYKPITIAVNRILNNITGTVVPAKSKEQCRKLLDNDKYHLYEWIKGGKNETYCVRSWGILTNARSPAFKDDNPKNWSSTEYSTWTESIWEISEARIFLRPSRTQEWITFFLGLIVFLISFILTFWLSKNSDKIFCSSPSSSTTEVTSGPPISC